jgi:hypothetical protein
MATKKVKKFGRGGDILTGVGAVLVGKALYDKYKGKGDDKDDDYTRKVKEFGRKGDYPDAKKEEKADAKKEEPQREEYKAVGNEGKENVFKKVPEYKKPDGPAAQDVSGKKPVSVVKKKKDKSGSSSSSSNTTTDAVTADDKKAGASDKPDALALKPGESKVLGEGNLKPYPVNLPSVRAAEHRKFLQTKAGIGGKGITTPGDPNAKGSTQKGRSANPIQGTIDNATRSTVRTDAEKMRERALEVERRRQEEKAAKQGYGIKKGGMVKKYASGGSVKTSKMGSVKTAKPTMRSASSRADGIAIRGKTRA